MNLKPLVLAAAVACSMAELGDVSREWERLSATWGGGSIASVDVCALCGSPKELRDRAAVITARANEIEHRQKTEARWRELVKACFPMKGTK